MAKREVNITKNIQCIITNILNLSLNNNLFSYTSDSPELQTRRLADLYMILGAWSLAFPLYQSAKRDFSADNAWMLYSGAVEMAAICALVCPSVCDNRKAIEYANESVLTYLNTCRFEVY